MSHARTDSKILLGCMVSSSVTITAARRTWHLVDYVDLDGNLLIETTHFRSHRRKRRLVPPTRPGLGLIPRPGAQGSAVH